VELVENNEISTAFIALTITGADRDENFTLYCPVLT